MYKINILAGGPEKNFPKNFKKFLLPTYKWIGVDAGAIFLINHGINDITSIGDFDSLTTCQYEVVKKKSNSKNFFQASPKKNFTDTELALTWVGKHYNVNEISEINLFGMTGNRLDHEMNNLLNIFLPPYKPLIAKIKVYDKYNIVRFFNAGKYVIKNERNKRYLGFVLLNNVTNFNIEEAKYNLKNFSSKIDRVFASNEFINNKKIRISFSSGNIMAIFS